MKKLALIFACALLCLSMVACGGDADVDDAEETKAEDAAKDTDKAKDDHVHKASAEYDRDYKEHWNVCECGKKVNKAKHKLDDEGFCSECKSHVDDIGGVYVYNVDENDNLIRSTYYDDDKLLDETFYEYAKDKNEKYYICKMISRDYGLNEFTETEYNEYDYVVYEKVTDADGNVLEIYRNEYEFDDDGYALWSKSYIDDVLVEEITGFRKVTLKYDFGDEVINVPQLFIKYYEDGSKYTEEYDDMESVTKETYYDKNGEVTKTFEYKHTYDKNYNPLSTICHLNGRIYSEEYYEWNEDETAYKYTSVQYHEDGSKTVTKYDESMDVISEIEYDKDGNEI